jgi:hypothetical protein
MGHGDGGKSKRDRESEKPSETNNIEFLSPYNVGIDLSTEFSGLARI